MNTIRDMEKYVSLDTRNKIVFCKDLIDGIDFLNVGHELSASLCDNVHDNMDALRSIMTKGSNQHSYIGQYLALENIGILFEPELKLDIRNLLDTYSKNQCLIIKSGATLSADNLYWLTPSDGIHINLTGLSYLEIKDSSNEI